MGCLVNHPRQSNDLDSTISILKKKILLLGLDGAGKTTILHFLKEKKFVNTTPTLGLNIETIHLKNLECLMFDISGHVRSLWTHYYENLNACIFVVDSTDKERLWQVREEFVKLNEDLKYQKVIFLIFFNKIDKKESPSDLSDLIESTGVKEILENDVIIQKCSALTGEGLYEGLEKLVNLILANTQKFL